MPKFVYDTNLYISKLADRIKPLETLYVSSVVIFERLTAAFDIGEYRSHVKSFNEAKAANLLIVPSPEDWLAASRISYRLAMERRAERGGSAPKLSAKVKQEIALDVLLAVSATRKGVTVVTTNRNDFGPIKRHCRGLEVLIVEP